MINIKEALKQGSCEKGGKNFPYSSLGLSDEVFGRVASSVETFITDEDSLKAWVSNPKTLELLQSYQSAADKVRTELNAKIKTIEGERDELKAKLAGNKPEPQPEPNPNPEPQPNPQPTDIAAIVQQAVATAVAPLQEKLTAFETANTQKSAVAALDELKATWDYAKGYPTECEDAYERVMELYEVSGKKWTADELKAKFTEKFNKAVSKKGVDTSKPFQGDGGGDEKPDFTSFDRAAEKLGWAKPEE